MSRGGVGSASIVLIFAILCLTIFTVISFVPALIEQNLISAEVQLVEAYYVADTLAERVLAKILSTDAELDNILGIEITSYWDWDLLVERVSFICPISETKELYVVAEIGSDFHNILNWQVRAAGEWEPDDRLNVWSGNNDWGF